MDDAAHKEISRGKMLLYSGHDTTILPVLGSLIGGKMDRWPPYLSHVVIELWKRKNAGDGEDAYFVTVIYNGEPLELNAGSQGTPLTLGQFKQKFWSKHNIQRDAYLELCKKDVPKPEKEVPNVGGDAVQGL